MKRILQLIGLSCIIYLSSCYGSSNDLPAPVTYDTTTNGSFVNVTLGSESFNITSLSLDNSPVYSMYASTIFNAPDATWACVVILDDHRSKQLAINVSGKNTDNSSTGTYTVATNLSTVTDYSTGQNKTYSVAEGSTINITTSGGFYIEGTLALNLVYDHAITPLSGTFRIFH